MKKILQRIITFHPFTSFLVMMAAALVFGLSSYNLFFLLKENLELVYEQGPMALRDGALTELCSLFGYGIISLLAYILFKCCEHHLSHWLLEE